MESETYYTVKPVLSGPHIKRTPASWVLNVSSHIYCKTNLYLLDPTIKRTLARVQRVSP